MSNAALLEARARANAIRGEHLSSVREGFLTPEEVISLSVQPGYEPLKKIRLGKLLLAQPGIGEIKAKAQVSEMLRAVVGKANEHTSPNVGWLTDRRASGRRLVIWANVRRSRDAAPWPGFPFTPKPSKKAD